MNDTFTTNWSGKHSAGNIPTLGVVKAVEDHERRRAAMCVALLAKDNQDARLLLEALGLR